MIDFHSHLDLYQDGLVLARETNTRNRFTLVVTTSPRAYKATSRVFAGLDNIQVGLGLHPEVASAKSMELDQLVGGVANARFIGEIGLDGSSRFRESLALQERIFRAALDAAVELRLGEKRTGQLQDLVGLAQLAVLTL